MTPNKLERLTLMTDVLYYPSLMFLRCNQHPYTTLQIKLKLKALECHAVTNTLAYFKLREQNVL
jgi:hypothetical protein